MQLRAIVLILTGLNPQKLRHLFNQIARSIFLPYSGVPSCSASIALNQTSTARFNLQGCVYQFPQVSFGAASQWKDTCDASHE